MNLGLQLSNFGKASLVLSVSRNSSRASMMMRALGKPPAATRSNLSIFRATGVPFCQPSFHIGFSVRLSRPICEGRAPGAGLLQD